MTILPFCPRLATLQDVPAIIEFAQTIPVAILAERKRWDYRVGNGFPNSQTGFTIIATDDVEVVGLLWVDLRCYEEHGFVLPWLSLNTIYVRDDMRGNQIGMAMVAYLTVAAPADLYPIHHGICTSESAAWWEYLGYTIVESGGCWRAPALVEPAREVLALWAPQGYHVFYQYLRSVEQLWLVSHNAFF